MRAIFPCLVLLCIALHIGSCDALLTNQSAVFMLPAIYGPDVCGVTLACAVGDVQPTLPATPCSRFSGGGCPPTFTCFRQTATAGVSLPELDSSGTLIGFDAAIPVTNADLCCASGYSGTGCRTYYGCHVTPCLNGGRCAHPWEVSPHCSCPNGWTGSLCDTPVAAAQQIRSTAQVGAVLFGPGIADVTLSSSTPGRCGIDFTCNLADPSAVCNGRTDAGSACVCADPCLTGPLCNLRVQTITTYVDADQNIIPVDCSAVTPDTIAYAAAYGFYGLQLSSSFKPCAQFGSAGCPGNRTCAQQTAQDGLLSVISPMTLAQTGIFPSDVCCSQGFNGSMCTNHIHCLSTGCKNGGECQSSGYCQCPTAFTGSVCETFGNATIANGTTSNNCIYSPWVLQGPACSVSCGGGTYTMARSAIESSGSSCTSTSVVVPCNPTPCPSCSIGSGDRDLCLRALDADRVSNPTGCRYHYDTHACIPGSCYLLSVNGSSSEPACGLLPQSCHVETSVVEGASRQRCVDTPDCFNFTTNAQGCQGLSFGQNPACAFTSTCQPHQSTVNCQVEWQTPGACSTTCGGGISFQSSVVNQAASFAGAICPGPTLTLPCNTQACSSCVYSAWTLQGPACSTACGVGGTYTQTRSVVESFGQACFDTTRTVQCDSIPCRTCSDGNGNRSLCLTTLDADRVSNPAGCRYNHLTSGCDADACSFFTETQCFDPTVEQACHNDGTGETGNVCTDNPGCDIGLSNQPACTASYLAPYCTWDSSSGGCWSNDGSTLGPNFNCRLAWQTPGSCSAVCGGGVMYQTATIEQQPGGTGAICHSLSRKLPCNTQECTPCQVSDWTPVTNCTLPCGGGTQTQTRTIIDAGDHPETCPPLTRTGAACNTQQCTPCTSATEYKKGTCACVGTHMALNEASDSCRCSPSFFYGSYCNNTCTLCTGGTGTSDPLYPHCSLGVTGTGCTCERGSVAVPVSSGVSTCRAQAGYVSRSAVVEPAFQSGLYLFALDLTSIGDLSIFENQFITELSILLSIPTYRIVVNDIYSGSVVVNASIGTDSSAQPNSTLASNSTNFPLFSTLQSLTVMSSSSSSSGTEITTPVSSSSSTGAAPSSSSSSSSSSTAPAASSSSSSSSTAHTPSASSSGIQSSSSSSSSSGAHVSSSSSSSSSTGRSSSSSSGHVSSSSSTGAAPSINSSSSSSSSSSGGNSSLVLVAVEASDLSKFLHSDAGLAIIAGLGALVVVGLIVATTYLVRLRRLSFVQVQSSELVPLSPPSSTPDEFVRDFDGVEKRDLRVMPSLNVTRKMRA